VTEDIGTKERIAGPQVEARWHEMVADMAARWPATSPDVLRETGGDRRRVAEHLARSHELTVAEARDAIDDWLALRAARFRA